MKRVFGLDLGTTSIGWAVIDQAENALEASSILKMGVRVNPLTVDEKDNFEKGKSITTTAVRTLKRGMRRNLQRYKLRRDNLISILKREHFINDDTILSESGNFSTFQTLRLRAKAAREEISLTEFARVLLMINKKRGYKSNRKVKNQDEGQLIDGMAIARKLYDDGLTPGQYTHNILLGNKNYIPSFYRSDLQAEYDLIWSKQQEFYPEILTQELKEQLSGRGSRDVGNIYAKHGIVAADVKGKKQERNRIKYRWRAEALSQQLPIDQVACVLSSIASDINSSSGYLGAIGDHSKELVLRNMTVGEYLLEQIDRDPHYRIKDRVYYRQDYLREFNTIWETQEQFHPELTPKLKAEIRDVVIFYQRKLKSKKGMISFCEFEGREITIEEGGKQRKVMTGPRVCPKSSPLFQEFKVWQVINNIEVRDTATGLSAPLDDAQRQLLHDELTLVTELKKNDILKRLGYKGKNYDLNYDAVQGNTTMAQFAKAFTTIVEYSGHDVDKFDKLTYQQKMTILTQVFDELVTQPEFLQFNYRQGEYTLDPLFKLWHLIYSYEDDKSSTGNEKLIKHIADMTGLDVEYAAVLADITFADDYGSLSSKAIDRILPHLVAGNKYSDACALAGYNHSRQSLTSEENAARELLPQLDVLAKNSLCNPVVEKILNQMIHVVNACMQAYGKEDENGVKRFDEIHVEMARDLKQSAKERENATKSLRDRTRENEKIMEILMSEFGIAHPSRNDILRYRLYEELKGNGYKTLYTGTYISKEKLFSRDFDIEHIIPQAVLYDDSYSNKTLESRQANIDKGAMTAYDYVLKIKGEEGAAEYERRVKELFGTNARAKCKKLLAKGDKLDEGFLNRDLNDTRYISSKAREMLLAVTRVVVPTTGTVTDVLREDWGLVDVMKELNWDKYDKLGLTETYRNRDGHEVRRIKDWTKRNDHRHHAMDALAVAFTRIEHIQYLNTVNARDENGNASSNMYALCNKLMKDHKFIPPIPKDELRTLTKKHMEEILISIKAKNKVVTRSVNRAKGVSAKQATLTPRNQLHNETYYGVKKRYVTRNVKVNGSLSKELIMVVARKDYRKALLARLNQFDGDPKKAFTKQNSLIDNPIWLNNAHTVCVPPIVKISYLENFTTSRKMVSPSLDVKNVMDAHVREILEKRIKEFGGDKEKAFINLEENPIWFNKEQGLKICKVKVFEAVAIVPIHKKRDKDGNFILDENGHRLNCDVVKPDGNHHIAIFEDVSGNLQEHVVSILESTRNYIDDNYLVDKNYNSSSGWRFLFTMKKNEYFVLPDPDNGFFPEEIDLLDESKYQEISKHLFRVQKMSSKNYMFRHHLDTRTIYPKELQNVTYVNIRSTNGLKGIVKVRINHIGKIVAVGEY
ncbi:MAG: type II CRISPR RNA-guided endonuclease Cas9 [Bacteroidales bacterium]|nr:type II CRISPR RNA-guided endonuclease Cas9 [Candidatus Sodaliphilus limicaballi]